MKVTIHKFPELNATVTIRGEEWTKDKYVVGDYIFIKKGVKEDGRKEEGVNSELGKCKKSV